MGFHLQCDQRNSGQVEVYGKILGEDQRRENYINQGEVRRLDKDGCIVSRGYEKCVKAVQRRME